MPYPQAANRMVGALATCIEGAGKLGTFPFQIPDGSQGIIITGLLVFALILAILVIIHWRKLYYVFGGWDTIGSCAPNSLTISRKCHPPAEEGDVSEKNVQYGLLWRAEGVRPALQSFTSGEVLSNELGEDVYDRNDRDSGAMMRMATMVEKMAKMRTVAMMAQ